jgi:hypothetical protein
MKRYTCVLTLIAAALAALVLPSTALAVENYHFRGKTAWGNSYSIDATGCISTSVYFFATEDRFQDPPGPPADSAAASIGIFQWNECTYETLTCLYASVALPNDAFSLANNLASATLNTTLQAYNCSTGDTQPVSVAITWTGEGDVFRGNSHSSYHYPGYRVSYRSNGQSRSATPSGSVTFGGTTLALENGFGYLSIANSGEVYNYN